MRPRSRPRARRHAPAAVALMLLLAACGGAGDPALAPATQSPEITATPEPQPEPEPEPPQTLRFAAVGDIGDGSPRVGRVAQAIADAHAEQPIDVLLLLGDMIYPHGDPAEYEEKFAEPYAPVFEAGIEIAASLGNHDLETDPEGLMEVFGMASRFYTFTRGPVQFFALDTSTAIVGPAQREWLDKELARSDAPWQVPFGHVPPFSAGWHGDHLSLQRQLVPILERHGVRLKLAAHDHNYERTVPINGVTYVISGGGCCPRPVGESDVTAASGTGLHFVLFDVGEDTMTLTAITADGEIMDRATILREPAAAAAAAA